MVIRVGIVSSSGGAVFSSGLRILNESGYTLSAAVITDRPCGIEDVCVRAGVPVRRIDYASREIFCTEASRWLYDVKEMEWTALFFTKLVDKSLYERAPCVNFHPSLLPKFPGLNALRKLMVSDERLVGATAHLVDASVDGGTILAQVSAPFSLDISLNHLERISFAQKLYLFLLICELNDYLGKGFAKSIGSRCARLDQISLNHSKLTDPRLEKTYIEFLLREGIIWDK
jgi:phosphoribosylglycinamide formyltransferase-1